MKIALYEMQSTFIRGGLQTDVWSLCSEFCSRGHTVHLYAADGPIRQTLPGDFALYTFPFIPRNKFPDFGSRFRSLCERLSFARHALGQLCRGNYDVIYISKPYDMIPALIAKRSSKARVIFKSGGTEFFPGYKLLAKQMDLFLACSRFNAEQIMRSTGLSPIVHYYGIRTSRFAAVRRDPCEQNRLGLGAQQFAAASIGRLVGWKGFQFAVEAMQMLREKVECRYFIFGDGEYRPQLERQIAEMGLSRTVEIRPGVSQDDVPSIYASVNAAIFPSVGDEALGISVIEAMASGLPVIATACGGMKESVVHNTTGFLVPLRDAQAIANSVDKLATNPGLAQAMGESGRARTAEHFELTRIVDELIRMIHALK